MIPIRAERRTSGRAIVVWAIALACAAVLLRLALMPQERALAVIISLGAVPARLLADPLSPAQLVTLVTSAFLHGGWVHLAGNLLYLIVFGPVVESRLGALRFSLLFIASGVIGTLAHVLADPQSTIPVVGASGAIAGVLGAHLVLEPRSRITTVVPVVVFVEVAVLPAAFVIALWFVLQVASAVAPVAAVAEGGQQVAWFAHLGGFAAGALLSKVAAAGRRNTSSRRGLSSSRDGGRKAA